MIPPSPFLLDDRAFPFLGPLQIGAVARQLGHEVRVADLTGYKQRHPEIVHASYDGVMDEAEKILWDVAESADLVGFYSLAAQHPQVVKLNAFIRKHNPSCVTALGGPHANTAPSRCLDDAFDYIVVSDQGGGGGEPGFIELLKRVSVSKDRLADRQDLGRQRGGLRVLKDNCEVGWEKNDRIIKLPSRLSKDEASAWVKDGIVYQNDRWPFPARDLIEIRSYSYLVGGERATSIVSATGCPFACTYSVTGDTYIHTDRGFERIDELMEGSGVVEACGHGGHVVSHRPDRFVSTAHGRRPIVKAMKEGIRPVFHIIMENGLKVKATAEHPFMALKDSVPSWKEVRHIRPGDWLVVKSPDHNWPTRNLELSSPPPVSKFANGKPGPRQTPTHLNEDVAWMAGFIVGDGCLPSDGRPAIHLSCTPDVHRKLSNLALSLFGVELRTYEASRTDKFRHGWLYGRVIYDFFTVVLGISPSAKHRVPELIRRSPKPVIQAFLDGLWDADGYDRKNARGSYLTTTRRGLADEVAQLLLMLGKLPYVHHIVPKGLQGFKNGEHYRVGFYVHDRIPTEKALYKSSKSGAWYWRTPRKKEGFLGVRRETLERSGLSHPLNVPGWHFVRVSSVVQGICEPVYDLSVDVDHSFLANGLVSHNCSHWDGYRKLEAKSSEKVREEIRQIRNEYGWRAFMFYDDEINLRPDFLTDFLPMLRSENVIWRAFFKNGKNLTTDEVFRSMAEAGCVQMCTGAEAADPKILKDIRKGATVEDNTAFVRLCVKHGIKPKVFTQIGLPGETPETVEALRNWLVRMAEEGLNDADVSITTPYEGTPIFESPEKYDIRFDKSELDFSKDVVLYKGIPGEYVSWVSHPRLTPDDIVRARQWVEDEFRKAAGLKPLLAKDDG